MVSRSIPGIVVIITAAAGLIGCATRSADTGSATGAAPASSAATKPASRAAPAAPVSGRFVKVRKDMDSKEVREILGKPTRETSYETGKRWIPFANLSGQDQRRMEWVYANEGRIVFTLNSYTGNWRVIEVISDSNAR